MRPNEVDYAEEVLKNIKAHPIARDNFDNLRKDYEHLYVEFLCQDFPLEPEQLSRLKSDLFQAFVFGCTTAVDLNSHFRIGFICPEELTFKGKKESGLFLPNQQLVDTTKKLIL